MATSFLYILASQRNGTLYIGVTCDLMRRVAEHQDEIKAGFTQKYEVHRLVYYEQFDRIVDAIAREKRLKKWKRQWKLELIEKHNLTWEDFPRRCFNEKTGLPGQAGG